MNDVLMYFLKVNIAIALFYLFYRLVFYNDTFWTTRRFYLIFSLLLSLAYPFISFSGWLEKQRPMQAIISNYVQLNEITVTARQTTHFTTGNIILAAYALISLVLLVKTLIQLGSVLRWRLKGKRQLLNGIQIVAIDETITPFSFFGSIFMNPALHDEQETSQILAHENTHVRQLHSLDVLLSEMLTITYWINPAAWLLKREIRHNLEFLADSSVLRSGFDSKNYQYHLLQLSYQVPENHLINKFNVSPLKKRIIMMNQQKTKKAGILKYSLIVPLALALVLSSNAQKLASSANKVVTATDSIKAKKAPVRKHQKSVQSTSKVITPVIKTDKPQKEKIYDSADKAPQFPDGENALLSFIARNLRYPKEAQMNGIQGKVYIRFVVNSTGKVVDAVVVKSRMTKVKKFDEIVVVGYGNNKEPETKLNGQGNDMKLLEQEAIRTINTLPNFTPGEINGHKVSVYYLLPITYRLE